MEKIDFKKKDKRYYQPSARQVTVLEIPEFQFVTVSGQIEPGQAIEKDQGFQRAMEALYGISYGLKFKSKRRESDPFDYVVLPLEGLWWTATSHQGFDFSRQEAWFYQLMIRQPDHIDGAMFAAAKQELIKKKGNDNPKIKDLGLTDFEEGLSIQIMHIGPYSEEPTTLALMDSFSKENGLVMRGKHHEIYLGDPRRAKPENLRTVLRHPVERGNRGSGSET